MHEIISLVIVALPFRARDKEHLVDRCSGREWLYSSVPTAGADCGTGMPHSIASERSRYLYAHWDKTVGSMDQRTDSFRALSLQAERYGGPLSWLGVGPDASSVLL